jgi:hypothetical protein
MAHVDFLIEWLEVRVRWLSDYYNGRPTVESGMFEGICVEEAMETWRLFENNRVRGPVTVIINDKRFNFAINPVIVENRVLLPLQEAGGLFGLSLRDLDEMELPVSMRIAGQDFIPLNIFTNALGYGAEWDAETLTATLTGPTR